MERRYTLHLIFFTFVYIFLQVNMTQKDQKNYMNLVY